MRENFVENWCVLSFIFCSFVNATAVVKGHKMFGMVDYSTIVLLVFLG